MKFLIVEHSPLPFSSLLGPNIRLRILFSNTVCLLASLNVRGHVPQPCSTTGNIIVLFILILNFLAKLKLRNTSYINDIFCFVAGKPPQFMAQVCFFLLANDFSEYKLFIIADNSVYLEHVWIR